MLGLPAMQRIQGAKVLLSGLQGLGAEVAKNLVLMGVGSLTLHDPHPTCWSDLAAQVRLLGDGGAEPQLVSRVRRMNYRPVTNICLPILLGCELCEVRHFSHMVLPIWCCGCW